MNFRNFYLKIEDIDKRMKSMDKEQFYRELQYFVQYHPWRSLLIYGSLYISQVGSSTILAFFARKTFEIIEKVCEQRIEKDNKVLKRDQNTSESEELQISNNLLDLLTISLTILVFAFDIPEQHEAIGSIEKAIQKKINDNRSRFIDKIPLDNYLKLFEHRFRQNEKAFQLLRTFFEDLITNAGWDETESFHQKANKFKKYIELLIEEVGYRIEKPDRIFSYANNLDTVINFAESLFSSTDKTICNVSFNKIKLEYLRKKSFDDLRTFWAACMTGLFAFAQSIDRFIALSKSKEKVQKEVASTQTYDKEEPVIREEKSSRGKVKKSKKSFFRKINSGYNPILKPVFAFK